MNTKTNTSKPSLAVRFRVGAIRLIVRGVIFGIMIAALYASYLEIRKTGTMLEMRPWQAGLLPLFVDGIALVGRLSMIKLWDAATQKRGMWIMAGGGLGSLVCNVYAGDTGGEKLFGALIVAVVVLLEVHAGRMVAVLINRLGEPRKTRTPEQIAASVALGQATKEARKAERAAAQAAAGAPVKLPRQRKTAATASA